MQQRLRRPARDAENATRWVGDCDIHAAIANDPGRGFALLPGGARQSAWAEPGRIEKNLHRRAAIHMHFLESPPIGFDINHHGWKGAGDGGRSQ